MKEDTMNTTAVSVEGFPDAPYSQAVKAEGLVFVSGQPGIDYSTGELSDNFETQARQAFQNLATVLRSAGSEMHLVIKTTIWLTDAANFEIVNKLYKEYFLKNAPTRSTPIIDLPKRELKISIEAIATLK
jgi:2-iminobutanoate/2-iminopropanoate deaminase